MYQVVYLVSNRPLSLPPYISSASCTTTMARTPRATPSSTRARYPSQAREGRALGVVVGGPVALKSPVLGDGPDGV